MTLGMLVFGYIFCIWLSLFSVVRATRKSMKGGNAVMYGVVAVVAVLAGIVACWMAIAISNSGFLGAPMLGVGVVWFVFLCAAPEIERQSQSANHDH